MPSRKQTDESSGWHRVSGDQTLIGAPVIGTAGLPLGTVSALLVDPGVRQARWLEVQAPDGGHAVVPVAAASADPSGRLVIPYSADDLRDAPEVRDGVVSSELAADLLSHYGFPPDPR